MDVEFKRWLNQTVQVSTALTSDGAGDPIDSVLKDLRCYMEGGTKLVINRQGEEVASTNTLYFDGADFPQLKDHIIVGTQRFSILQIVPYYDERGIAEMVEVSL